MDGIGRTHLRTLGAFGAVSNRVRKTFSGCISFVKSEEGRSTWLGHTDTQSWQAVQCCAKWRALSEPGGVMGVARSGIFLSSMTASPPSTFFSCALRAAVAANAAVVEKCAAGVVYLLPVPRRFFLRDCSGGRLAACVSDGTFPALVDTVHTCHATAVIYFVCLDVDARCLAVYGHNIRNCCASLCQLPVSARNTSRGSQALYLPDRWCYNRYVRLAMPAR